MKPNVALAVAATQDMSAEDIVAFLYALSEDHAQESDSLARADCFPNTCPFWFMSSSLLHQTAHTLNKLLQQ